MTKLEMFEARTQAGLDGAQVQVLIRAADGSLRTYEPEQRVEMPERFGAWRRRGYERYVFDATPEGDELPPSVFRDGYATGYRAALLATFDRLRERLIGIDVHGVRQLTSAVDKCLAEVLLGGVDGLAHEWAAVDEAEEDDEARWGGGD